MSTVQWSLLPENSLAWDIGRLAMALALPRRVVARDEVTKAACARVSAIVGSASISLSAARSARASFGGT